MSGGEALLFWILGPTVVLGGLGLLLARKAVHAAMSMAVAMVGLGLFYIAQHAEFVGIIQIFVYSGAVMMMFLFVVMMVGVDASDSMVETITGHRVWAVILGLSFAAVGVYGLSRVDLGVPVGLEAAQAEGPVTALAREIFTRQVLGFEALAALLVIAVIGAMVLAHRERLLPRRTQRELSEERIRGNEWVAGKPNPGVLARHNSANTPGLLPDGTPAEASVPRVLVARDQVIPIEPGAYVPGRREHDGTHHRRDEGHPEGPTDGKGPTGPVGELEDGEVTR